MACATPSIPPISRATRSTSTVALIFSPQWQMNTPIFDIVLKFYGYKMTFQAQLFGRYTQSQTYGLGNINYRDITWCFKCFVDGRTAHVEVRLAHRTSC